MKEILNDRGGWGVGGWVGQTMDEDLVLIGV
jgi:hypothetical protein